MLPLHRLNNLIPPPRAALFFFLYATFGHAKPFAIWKWMDIVSEGGTAVMAIWFCSP
jgi:hypothetical protein